MTMSLTTRTLPREIFQQVFDNLSVWDKIHLSMVNKEWKSFFDEDTWVWESLDFEFLCYRHVYRFARCRNITAMVHFYLAKSGLSLRRLLVKISYPASLGSILLKLENYPKLTDLTVHHSYHNMHALECLAGRPTNLKRLDLEGQFGMEIPVIFLQNSTKLESAKFTFLDAPIKQCLSTGTISSELKSLIFDATWSNYSKGTVMTFPSNIIDRAFGLERLIILGYHQAITSDYRHLTKLRELSILCCDPVPELVIPSSVTILHTSLDVLGAISENCPSLELKILKLRYYLMEDNFSCKALMKNLETGLRSIGDKVEELCLEDRGYWGRRSCANLYAPVIRTFIKLQKLKSVKHLTVFLIKDWLSDIELLSISEAFPRLKQISVISKGHLVTDDDLKRSFTACPEVKILSVYLGRILGADMLRWMKDRNVSVTPVEHGLYPWQSRQLG